MEFLNRGSSAALDLRNLHPTKTDPFFSSKRDLFISLNPRNSQPQKIPITPPDPTEEEALIRGDKTTALRTMLWYCSHCLRSCPTMREGDFISCSDCGKVLGDRTSAADMKRAVKKSGVAGSKRVQIRRRIGDGIDTHDSNAETESEESSSS